MIQITQKRHYAEFYNKLPGFQTMTVAELNDNVIDPIVL